MNSFPDTSFLYALYRPQENSQAAQACYQRMTEPLHVSLLLLFEFRQSTRLQIWLRGQDKTKGIPEREGTQMLANLESNLQAGALVVAAVDWAEVFKMAERLSGKYTQSNGHRALDTLHVATALHLRANEFLTFDANQQKLARAAGLKVRP